MRRSTVILLVGLGAAVVLAYLYYANRSSGASGDVVASAVDSTTSALQSIGGALGITTPRGIRNNNPGNIVRTSTMWQGQLDQATVEAAPPAGLGIAWDPTFVQFDTPANGVRAMGHVLLSKAARGLTSVDQIVRDYSATDQDAYVATVSRIMGVDPNATLDVPQVLPQLVAAMIQDEDGTDPYAFSDLQQWVYT